MVQNGQTPSLTQTSSTDPEPDADAHVDESEEIEEIEDRPAPPRPPRLPKGIRRRGRLLAAALAPPGSRLTVPPPRTVPKTPRLVESPVFVLSSVRSGSTLLRVLLNSHRDIYAPHELHLRTLHVEMTAKFTADIMGQLGLDKRELEHLLWDRVLHLELCRSGKQVIVDKTPANARMWQRLRDAWPQARFIFLRRDPAAIISSVMNRRSNADREQVVGEVSAYLKGMYAAQQSVSGVAVRYEDLTAEPERHTRRVCEYLGLEWDPEMLEYGKKQHGPFKPFFGDWSSNIKSGKIQPAREAPADEPVPAELAEIAESWGYRRG